ncbi:hypothetical protein Gotur_023241 [Gossypium turneri]
MSMLKPSLLLLAREEEAKKRIYSVCTTTYTGWRPRDVTQNR